MSESAIKKVSESENKIKEAEEMLNKMKLNDLKNEKSMKNSVDFNGKIVFDEDFRIEVKKLPIGVANLPKNWNDLTVREQRDWVTEKIKLHCPNLPESLLFLIVGNAINGDCQRPIDAIPHWLDRKKFERGQRFAMANYVGITLAEMISLHMLFSIDYGLKPLIISGKSSEPFTAFKRYLSTVRRVRNWYSSDVWTKGTAAYEDIQIVRNMHSNVRKKLGVLSNEEIDEASKIRNPWSTQREKIREDFRETFQPPSPGNCPLMFRQVDQTKKPKNLNQAEMALTQFGFMGLVILYPEKFGIYGATEEDIEAFCHLWRGLGYLLGIEDEFNVCNGSVDQVKKRARDSIEYWIKPNLREISPEWEHMMRCVIEGISYYFPRITYEISLLYLADVLCIPVPRFEKSLSLITRIRFYLLKFTFSFTVRLPGAMERINRRVHGYIDRALSFTDQELALIQKKSEISLTKGISDTIAVENNSKISDWTVWRATPFLLFLATFFLLNLPIMKEIPGKIDLTHFVFLKSNV